MSTATIETLKAPGATLHYEVRGSGPVLLMIAGGPADAGVFEGVAGVLADRYTVVTYDPRGNSRSSLDGPPEDQRVGIHAVDAHRLLAAVGTEPAYVLGSSGGALVGLDLVDRYPDQVHTLVAHEPPLLQLLPDAASWRAFGEEVYETYRRDGVGPAMQKFGEGVGLEAPEPDAEVPPEALEAMARMGANIDFFLAHVFRPLGEFVPHVTRLQAAPCRIVLAGGEESRTKPHPAYRAAVAIAERLGTQLVHFPGQHGGFSTHPAGFAETLHSVLSQG